MSKITTNSTDGDVKTLKRARIAFTKDDNIKRLVTRWNIALAAYASDKISLELNTTTKHIHKVDTYTNELAITYCGSMGIVESEMVAVIGKSNHPYPIHISSKCTANYKCTEIFIEEELENFFKELMTSYFITEIIQKHKSRSACDILRRHRTKASR